MSAGRGRGEGDAELAAKHLHPVGYLFIRQQQQRPWCNGRDEEIDDGVDDWLNY